MKNKVLSITIVAAILLTVIAIPVLAEDEIPMWVSSIRLAYKGRNTAASSRLLGTVAVRDANQEPVAGAHVVVEFEYPNGWVWLTSEETDGKGTASFRILRPDSGTYELCVTTVSKAGWEYIPALNHETCETLRVP